MTDKIICKTYDSLTQDCSSKLDTPLATQIIIDGVDVAKCSCFSNWHVIMTSSGEVVKEIENCCTPRQKLCEEINCIFKKQYKQLQRTQNQYNAVVEQNKNLQKELQRKEEELKMETSAREAKQDIINMLNNKYYNLEEQLKASQQKVKELEEECKELKSLHIDLAGVKECEIRELKQYKQALEEIKGIIKTDFYCSADEERLLLKEILQKCEVLNDI